MRGTATGWVIGLVALLLTAGCTPEQRAAVNPGGSQTYEQEREAYRQRTQQSIDQAKAEAARLRQQLASATADQRAKISGVIAELDAEAAAGAQKLKELAASNQGNWGKFKGELDKVGHRIDAAVDRAKRQAGEKVHPGG